MPPSCGDIGREFADIAVEVERLSSLLARVAEPSVPPTSQQSREATRVCASAAESIYTGCERIMQRLATEIDGSRVTHSNAWHARLLSRMAEPYPGIRGAIISAVCHTLLDRLRAFRHLVRNSYGSNLDFGIVVLRARDAVAAFVMFRRQVESFLAE